MTQTPRFEAYGWHVLAVDGHDMDAVSAAIAAAKADAGKPSLIRCKTVIGFGAPNKAGSSAVHGAPLGVEEISGTRAALGWDHAQFEIPAEIMANWRVVGSRGSAARAAWQARRDDLDTGDFDKAMQGDWDREIEEAVRQWKTSLAAEPLTIATRVASQKAIEAILPACPAMFGGSADLTGSNNTRVNAHEVFSKDNYGGSYIHYGVREHGMAAAMNGIALHGGAIPYGATFLVFTDYCRPSIRLSALMRQRVVYVMTHDSIGLGEDGPTHQPVEHLAALRAIPNLNVFRPADAVETVEAWQCALASKATPSILALSRQGLAQFRTNDLQDNKTARGAYVAAGDAATGKITLLASGSEVAIALAARETLAENGLATTVVSVPCLELFWQQDATYRKAVLGSGPRIVIEAALRQPWDRLLNEGDGFVGMDDFGASAPIADLYENFNITSSAVAKLAIDLAE